MFHDFFIGPDYLLNSIFRRNGQLPASRAFTVQGPDGGNVLNVRAASPADGDEYFCLAENMAGSVRASATVTVHCEFYLDNNSAMLRTRTRVSAQYLCTHAGKVLCEKKCRDFAFPPACVIFQE